MDATSNSFLELLFRFKLFHLANALGDWVACSGFGGTDRDASGLMIPHIPPRNSRRFRRDCDTEIVLTEVLVPGGTGSGFLTGGFLKATKAER